MKKLLVLILATAMALCAVGCNRNNKDSGSDGPTGREQFFEDDFEFEKLDGKETEVQILYTNSVNVGGAGYPDVTLPIAKESLIASGVGVEGISQYFFTKSLYNYNVKNNHIRIRYEDWSWADALTQKLTAAFNSGVIPDIVIGETQVPTYARNGLLEPFPDDLAALVREKIINTAYKAMEYNGKIYGVAIQPSITTLVWNKQILRNSGVDEKYIENAPATWAEFLEICGQIRTAGRGKFYPGGLYCGDDLGGYMRSGAFLYANGGGYMNGDGSPAFDTQANKEVLEYFRDVAAYSTKGMLSTTEVSVYNAFNSGKLAYIIDGSWRIKQSTDLGLDVGYGSLPTKDGGDGANVILGACYYCVPTAANHKAEAFKVIESMLTDEIQMKLGEYDYTTIVSKAVGNSEEYKAVAPTQSRIFELLQRDNNYSLPEFSKNSSSVYAAMGEAIKKSVTTTDSIEDLLRAAQSSAEALLRQ